jgi:ABC-type uncharacterized transport system permease subunit
MDTRLFLLVYLCTAVTSVGHSPQAQHMQGHKIYKIQKIKDFIVSFGGGGGGGQLIRFTKAQ